VLQVNLSNSLDARAGNCVFTWRHILHDAVIAVKLFIFRGLTMTARHLETPRFIRKTQLAQGEYRKNFHQIDDEIIKSITSPEADQVTPLMSKVYLRLVRAPTKFWEREGVLRFEAECREGKQVKAWTVLCELMGVASATANKALSWMHEQGIIGYFSGKNGVGIRIFLNRAASSIGTKATSGGRKILDFSPASSGERAASQNEPAFKDSFAVLEVSDTDINPHAPKNGADTKTVDKKVLEPIPPPDTKSRTCIEPEGRELEATKQHSGSVSVNEIVERLKNELEPCVKAAAMQAATQTAEREMARTREWFETKALPKAVRVAQHETYDLLRKHGSVDERKQRARADLEVGRAAADSYTPPVAHKPTLEEIRETAETCMAFLETQGKSIGETLFDLSTQGGGWLLPEDAPRVREAVLVLLSEQMKTTVRDHTGFYKTVDKPGDVAFK
jgi:hypothetical protein